MLRLLELYIDLSYDIDWMPGNEPVIYRPVLEIAEQLDISERQVRNIERTLAELGLLSWRDSGNHHRKGRRDRHSGQLIYAYGATLAPLGCRCMEIIALAQNSRTELAELRRCRIAISALRRQIRASIALLPDTEGAERLLDSLPVRNPAGTPLAQLEAQRSTLRQLASSLNTRLQELATVDSAGKPEINGRHNTDIQTEHSMNGYHTPAPRGTATQPPANGRAPQRGRYEEIRITLPIALKGAGPAIRQAMNGQTDWPTLIDAARVVARMHGIDDGLWGMACSITGRQTAALCTILLERPHSGNAHNNAGQIHHPRAYFRALIQRAVENNLNLMPSLRALARARTDTSSQAWTIDHAA
jgi:replication initiation protein RepC